MLSWMLCPTALDMPVIDTAFSTSLPSMMSSLETASIATDGAVASIVIGQLIVVTLPAGSETVAMYIF